MPFEPAPARGLARLLRLLDAVGGGVDELAERVPVVARVAGERPRELLVRGDEAQELGEDGLRHGSYAGDGAGGFTASAE